MKKLLFILILVFTCATAQAKSVIYYSTGETIAKVLDLPSDEEFSLQTDDGEWIYADLGIMHEQFSIFGVPIWNYGTEKYVLYSDDLYAVLDRDDITYIQSVYSEIPDNPELPFWDVFGGKLVLILVLLVVFFFSAKD